MEGRQLLSESTASPVKEDVDIGYLVRTMKESVDTVGLTPEVKELLEEVDSIKYKLEVKNAELSILEAIAMESTDQNVVELREQLFTLVKLLYSDKIEEISENFMRNKTIGASSYSYTMMDEQEPDKKLTNHSILSRISVFFGKRKQYKKAIKHLNSTNNATEDCCESAG